MSSGGDEAPHSSTAPGIGQNLRKHPCVLCQQRKVKCDRNSPCANCTKARVECVSPVKSAHKRRKKRFPEAELLARLRKYEEHLRRYGADIDAINQEVTPIPTRSSIQDKTEDIAGPDGYKTLSVRWSLKNVKSDLWDDLNHEFRDIEEILQGSSDDDGLEAPITTTYDEAFLDAGDLLFSGPAGSDIASLHPPPVQIFRLWQTFLDNVNPLIKLFHAPTIQQQILDASASLDTASAKIQVLMFGIYSMAITSLSEEECNVMFGGDKVALSKQYQFGARQALLRANFLRSSDMTVLQGYTLYLLSCHAFVIDPRALFCLTGIAIRIAQRMGLNYDGTHYGLVPYEIEMRRRLWWQILFLDSRVGELSGSGPTILQHTWTTKLPSNVNDSDLFPDMRDPAAEHPGITEMVFVLQKCEVAQFTRQFKSFTGLPAIDQKVADDFEQRLEQRYLKYCDPQVPVHLITRLMASTSIARLRAGVIHPHLMCTLDVELPQAEQDRGFILCLRQIKNHQTLMHSKSLSRFQWHVAKHFPFPAYLVVLRSLRQRTSDSLADEAWKLLEDHFEHRPSAPSLKLSRKFTLHLAIANLVVKAWEAREAAASQSSQPIVQTPQFVLRLKEDIATSKSQTPSTTSTGTLPEGPIAGSDSLAADCSWMDQLSMGVGAGFNDTAMLGATDSSSWAFWGNYPPSLGAVQDFDGSNMQGFDGSSMQGFYQN